VVAATISTRIWLYTTLEGDPGPEEGGPSRHAVEVDEADLREIAVAGARRPSRRAAPPRARPFVSDAVNSQGDTVTLHLVTPSPRRSRRLNRRPLWAMRPSGPLPSH